MDRAGTDVAEVEGQACDALDDQREPPWKRGSRCPWWEPRDAAGSQDVFFLPFGTHGEEGGGDDHGEENTARDEIVDHRGTPSGDGLEVASREQSSA